MMLHLGLVANEFFDPAIGRVGGFGWAARSAIDAFGSPGSPVDRVTLLPAEELRGSPREIAGCRAYYPRGRRLLNRLQLLGRSPDILLCIDYRPSYRVWFDALPDVPIIIWARDPKDDADWDRLAQLRVPGADATPAGIGKHDTRSLASYAARQRRPDRPVLVTCKLPHLQEKVQRVYGIPDSGFLLCNPDVVDYARVHDQKSVTPLVVFLGRLDPVKRPWLFLRVAEQLPEVEFVMAGQNHFSDGSGWQPAHLPPNVSLVGNVTGEAKARLLARAWVLLNTSIHEESPVSVFEALAHEVPAVSATDWGGIAGRFGAAVEPLDDEDELVRRLTDEVRKLVGNADLRESLGHAGRQFVTAGQTTSRFLEQFRALCVHAGLSPECG